MSAAPVDVHRYSLARLKRLLSERSGAASHYVSGKPQLKYLGEYFRDLRATTVVVEREYVDHDFLEDFAAYYVKCFQQYRSRCTRLHFFSASFRAPDFRSLLERG